MMTWVMDGKVNVISIADREKTEMEEECFRSVHEMFIHPVSWRRSKKCHRYSAELYQLYRTDGRCIIHAVFLETWQGHSGM